MASDESHNLPGISPEYSKAEVLKAVHDNLHRLFLLYEPGAAQLRFHNAGLDAIYRAIFGGNRSSKSHCCTYEILMHASGVYPSWFLGYRYTSPVTIWVIGKTTALVRETVLTTILGKGLDGTGILHPSHIKGAFGGPGLRQLKIHWRDSGRFSTISFKTMKQSVQSLQGVQVQIVYIDEEPPYEYFSELKMRITNFRGQDRGSLMAAFTPKLGRTQSYKWFHDHCSKETLRDGRIWFEFTWRDNPALPLEVRKQMALDSTQAERQLLEFGVPPNRHGPVYPLRPNEYIVEPFLIKDSWKKILGVDFGQSHPTVVVALAVDPATQIVYAYDEYSVRERSCSDHANHWILRGWHKLPMACDPSGYHRAQNGLGSVIGRYEQLGFYRMFPADNKLEFGINEVHELLSGGRLKIMMGVVDDRGICDGCPILTDEMQNYIYDSKGRPSKYHQDSCDALRYAAVSLSVAATEGAAQRVYVDC